MDDGTKLKPWGAPPITGTFAIAFEVEINSPAKQFTITALDAYNHVTVHENFVRHHLVYQTNTLVSVVQDPNNFVKVSFEDVGLVGANTVRGFVVLEATVGTCTQIATSVRVLIASPSDAPPIYQEIPVPPGTDPNAVEGMFEEVFRKEEGHLMLIISQGAPAAIQTLIDLNGRWAYGGSPGPIISTALTSLAIDMSAYNRPSAHGSIVDASTITVTFPGDATYTGKLQLPNRIQWSNGSAWTKV
jgi:hypothetical protein